MGAVMDFAATRPTASFRGATMRTAAERPLPKGCKGAACPAFALCQGRCVPAEDESRAFDRTRELHEAG